MNSFNFGVIRNVKIVGMYGNMACFEKRNRYGCFNSNKGTYLGGVTYAFGTIEKVTATGVEVHTGKFVARCLGKTYLLF